MRRRERNIYRDSRKKRRRRRQRNAIILGFLCIVIGLCFLIFQKSDFQKGVSALKSEQYQDAVVDFQESIKKGKKEEQAYRGLGIAYFELGQYKDAVTALEKAVEAGTEKTDVLCSFLGSAYIKTEQYEKAVDILEEGIHLEECGTNLGQEMRYNQIVAYENMGAWENAKNCMVEYLVKYPEDEEAKREADFLETR